MLPFTYTVFRASDEKREGIGTLMELVMNVNKAEALTVARTLRTAL